LLHSQERKKRGKGHIISTGSLARRYEPGGRGRKTNVVISRELNVSERTIESVKKRFVEGGIASALQGKPKTIDPNRVKFDGAFEARLATLACSPPPKGRARWTVRL
jgi:hypothetical protein